VFIYSIGAAMMLISIVLGSTGLFDMRIYIVLLVGALMVLVNALYWAHWFVVIIVVAILIGIYLLFKNMTVG
jgi:hypothetical protein